MENATKRHTDTCRRVPLTARLIALLESGEFSPKTLADRYMASESFITGRLRLAGVADSKIEDYSGVVRTFRRCRRCDIIIFDEDDDIQNHPEWSLRVQRDINGLCPGCHQFNETGHERLMGDEGVVTSVFSRLSIQ